MNAAIEHLRYAIEQAELDEDSLSNEIARKSRAIEQMAEKRKTIQGNIAQMESAIKKLEE